MAEIKQKRAEEKAQEKTIQKLLAFQSAKTFSRHAFMDTKDYVKEIGYEGEDEEVATNKALANLMSDYSVTRIKIKSHIEMALGVIQVAENKTIDEILSKENK